MFKKTINVVGSFASRVAQKAKIMVAVAFGFLIAVNATAQSQLDGFISTDATTGDPVADPSKITTFLKNIIVLAYSNWITLALIFVVVGIITYILWKKK